MVVRPKFRKWFTAHDGHAFVEALDLLGDQVEDPSREGWIPRCRDPDDEYLVALAAVHQATMLVSGDKDLLAVAVPGLSVGNPRTAVEALAFRHPWGRALIPGTAKAAFAQAEAEGHGKVLKAVSVFLAVIRDQDAVMMLPEVVTRESLSKWQNSLAAACAQLDSRGMASRAEYPSPGIAYVKLPPDPGVHLRATGEVLLEGAVIVTLLQRPELPDPAGLGGWRVHSVGDYMHPDEMPTP